MKIFYTLLAALFLAGMSFAAGRVSSGSATQTAVNSTSAFPKDIYPDTGNRLPAIRRADLDDTGRKLFDARGNADFFGPGAIRLYSPAVEDSMSTVNDFLRHKSALDPRLVELTILVTAREFDCEYVWTAHEPQALKAGLPQATVDVVKFRKPLDGLDEKQAVIIQLGRETLEKHHVSSPTAARALDLFGKQGLVNLVSLIGDYASTSILLTAFDQHVRPADKPLLPIP